MDLYSVRILGGGPYFAHLWGFTHPANPRRNVKREIASIHESIAPIHKIGKPKHPADVFGTSMLAGDASRALSGCEKLGVGRAGITAHIARPPSNRCRVDSVVDRVCTFVCDFTTCVRPSRPTIPFPGTGSDFSTALRMDLVFARGAPVPHFALYSLIAFGDALGIALDVQRPAVNAAALSRRTTPAETAPPTPLDLLNCRNN